MVECWQTLTETNGFMLANLDQVIGTNIYKKYIVKFPNTVNDIVW